MKSRDRCLAVSVDRGVFRCWHCGWSGGLRDGARPTALQVLQDGYEQTDRNRQRLLNAKRDALPLSHEKAGQIRHYLARRGLGRLLEKGPPRDLYALLRYAYWDTLGLKPILTGHYPVMLAVVRDPAGRPVTWHRTYLAHDGSKKAPVPSPKKIMPPARRNALRGAAIRLYKPAEEIGLAEGIETALAVSMDTGIPTWACICAHGLATVEIPESVRCVRLFVDADDAGRDAGAKAAVRLSHRGLAVFIHRPQTPGADWLDVVNGAAI